MGASFGLAIVLGVVVDVVHDDDVGPSQVDAAPARSRGDEEDFDGGVVVEFVDEALARVDRGLAIDAGKGQVHAVEDPLKDIQHHRELGEDQHPVALEG